MPPLQLRRGHWLQIFAAAPGRPWFWILLPKQKDLVVRGRNPAKSSPPSPLPSQPNNGHSGQRRGMVIPKEAKE